MRCGASNVSLDSLLRPHLIAVTEALEMIVGVKPAFMRPPYGEYNGEMVLRDLNAVFLTRIYR